MRIVITGASGSVGTALLRELHAEHEVVGVVRRPPKRQGVYERIDWCSLDLVRADCQPRPGTILKMAVAQRFGGGVGSAAIS